jgi:D-glycero-alpha-D-manno-heptose-7-phosphate kinase
MILTRTPFRVSFFGGGTDYPAWYTEHGGRVLSAAIDKYCWLIVRYKPPFHDHRYRIVYRRIETCNAVEQIEHPVVRAALQHLGVRRGLDIHHEGDLPARTGMGTSSAFSVGLLHALHARAGREVAPLALALEAIDLEQRVLGETVGSQDQVAAACGGLNRVRFARDGVITVEPIHLGPGLLERLQAHLLLVFSGITRTAEQVAKSYVDRLVSQEPALHALAAAVDEGAALLEAGDLEAFGTLLDRSWDLKRSLSDQVSNPRIDGIHAAARAAGAFGAKLTGAGGGGFLLLVVPPERRAAVCEALRGLIQVPIRIEPSGSRVVFADPGEDWEQLDAAQARLGPTRFMEPEGGGG